MANELKMYLDQNVKPGHSVGCIQSLPQRENHRSKSTRRKVARPTKTSKELGTSPQYQ